MACDAAHNPVTRPAHYNRGGITPWDVIDAWGLSHYDAAAIEYICRASHKGEPIQDRKKAIQNLMHQIELEEKAQQAGG